MKAITCSQCGALIKRININDKLVECEYCHASIPILKDNIVEIPDKKPPIEQKFMPLASYDAEPATKSYNPLASVLLLIVGIGGFVVLLGAIFLIAIFSPPKTTSDNVGLKTETEISSTPFPSNVPSFSYKTSVSYNSLINAELIETPKINPEQVDNLTFEDLKKDVFKEKRIRVEIKINADGEVTDAKALNGHEILKESSVRAAKESLFAPRKGERKTTLTYIFVLLDEPK